MLIDRIPPQALDAEATLIAACCYDEEALRNTVAMLQPSDFYKETHEALFRAIQAVAAKEEPIEYFTLRQHLIATGQLEKVGGLDGLTAILNDVPRTSNARFYAEIVREKSVRRRQINLTLKAAQETADETQDAAEIRAALLEALLTLEQRGDDQAPVLVSDVAAPLLRDIETRTAQQTQRGVLTGMGDLDFYLGRGRPGEVTVISAITGYGKSTSTLQWAAHIARTSGPVLYVSMELDEESQVWRRMADLTGWDSSVLETGLPGENLGEINLNCRRQLTKLNDEMATQEMLFLKHATMTADEIRSAAHSLQQKLGRPLAAIFIDRLEMIEIKGKQSDSQAQLVAAKTKAVKRLAVALRTHVFLVSQLSREVSKRLDKRPVLSDLKDSSSIEQDAQRVVFIHAETEPTAAGSTMPATIDAEFIIAKNSHGPKDVNVRVRFLPRIPAFRQRTWKES